MDQKVRDRLMDYINQLNYQVNSLLKGKEGAAFRRAGNAAEEMMKLAKDWYEHPSADAVLNTLNSIEKVLNCVTNLRYMPHEPETWRKKCSQVRELAFQIHHTWRSRICATGILEQ